MNVDSLIDLARGCVGHDGNSALFCAVVGPGEAKDRAEGLATLSTCALFIRGLLAWTYVGQQLPRRLRAPYVIGQAMADIIDVGRAITSPTPLHTQLRIVPGMALILGQNGHEHALLVESVERDGWPWPEDLRETIALPAKGEPTITRPVTWAISYADA